MNKILLGFFIIFISISICACDNHKHTGNVQSEVKEELNQDNNKLIEEFEKKIKINPNNYLIYQNLGTLYLKENKIDKAIKNLKKSISIKQDNYIPYEFLCNIYEMQNKPELAIETYNKGIKLSGLNNGKIILNNGLGQLYEKQKKYDLAFKAYEASMAIPIDNESDTDKILISGHPAELSLSKLYMKLDKDKLAIDIIKKSPLSKNITEKAGYLGLCNAFIIEKDFNTAIKTANKVIKKFPSEPDGYVLLGYCYENQNKYSKSLENYQTALDMEQKLKNPNEKQSSNIKQLKDKIDYLQQEANKQKT